MRNKPQINRLKAYLGADKNKKNSMAEYFKITPNCIDVWISRGYLPKTISQFVFRYINENERKKA